MEKLTRVCCLLLLMVTVPTVSARIEIGKEPPSNVGRLGEAGEKISLKTYQGRYVVLTFWRASCKLCLKEMVAFSGLVSATGQENLAVIAVNRDGNGAVFDSFAKVLAQYPIILSLDIKGFVARRFEVTQEPAVFVIDPDGALVFQRSGYSESELPTVLAEVRAIVESQVEGFVAIE